LIALRKPLRADARRLAEAGNHPEIADTMISLPNPFCVEDAEAWITATRERSDADGYVIEHGRDTTIIGAAQLRDIDLENRQAEVSFWLVPAMWGQGCASSALRQLCRIGFDRFGLNRLYGYHMARNPASGQVMARCGFQLEGCLRQRIWKHGRAEDVMLWSRLARDPLGGAQ